MDLIKSLITITIFIVSIRAELLSDALSDKEMLSLDSSKLESENRNVRSSPTEDHNKEEHPDFTIGTRKIFFEQLSDKHSDHKRSVNYDMPANMNINTNMNGLPPIGVAAVSTLDGSKFSPIDFSVFHANNLLNPLKMNSVGVQTTPNNRYPLTTWEMLVTNDLFYIIEALAQSGVNLFASVRNIFRITPPFNILSKMSNVVFATSSFGSTVWKSFKYVLQLIPIIFSMGPIQAFKIIFKLLIKVVPKAIKHLMFNTAGTIVQQIFL